MIKFILSFTILLTSLGHLALAQQGSHSGHQHRSTTKLKDVSATEIAKPGELTEIVLGRADAPITIIEYASITCGHCGRFHRVLLPKVKAKYIDTGIARLFVREFPLDNVAAAAALLARCAGDDATYDVLEAFFVHQRNWLFGNDVRGGLLAITQTFGIGDKDFRACLDNKALLKKISNTRRRATQQFGVRSTPTFFINGKPLVGPKTLAQFDEIIAPMINK